MQSRTTEPGKLPAGVLAILVHLAFLALLVFGVSWRTQSPAPVTAELWQSLPAPPQTTPVLPPPEPKPAPKPEPKPEPKVEPEVPKPDIALKEKEEKLKREQQEKQKLEEERKKDLEKKKEEERKKQEKLKEEQARKASAEKESQARAQAEQALRASGDAKVNEFKARIQAKIKSNTIIPLDVVGNPEVVYEITLLPGGDILNVRLVKSSGFPSYDDAAERAIRKSAPLPVPSGDLFQSKFRVGNYAFRPKSIE